MNNYPPVSRSRAILCAIAVLLVLPLCYSFYSHRSKTYSPVEHSNSSISINITNPAVIQNWLPQSAYDSMLLRINNYLVSNGARDASLTIKPEKISLNSNGDFVFSVVINPGEQTHKVLVKVINFASVLSSSTYFDGQLLSDAPATDKNGPRFTDFDSLLTVGLSNEQVSGIQNALQQYNSTASSFSVDSSSVQHQVNKSNSGPTNFDVTFRITIDGQTFNARDVYQNSSDTHLYLYSLQGDLEYDSGVLAGAV